jgi:DNA-binding GntR family transcriptional regulator
MADKAPAWRTKSEAAYYEVRERVLDGRLAPGTDLDQESLAREIGLSTTPVREALRRLEAEGLVIQRAHFAIHVPELSRREIRDIYAVRLMLEPEAVRLACEVAPDETLKRVRLVLEDSLAVRPGTLSPLDRLQINRDFHRGMYAASGNETLTAILDSLWDRCDRYRLQLLKQDATVESSVKEHQQMADAFCAREGQQLAEFTRSHLHGSSETLIELLS